MKKVILYIATSIDGYIAKKDGSVDWLHEGLGPDADFGYNEFYDSIGTTLMGFKTFDQVLGFGEFPYKDKENFVFTTKEREAHPYVTFVQNDTQRFVADLKKGDGKPIWLVGGGQLNSHLLDHDLIDEIMLFTMPVILGEGITLFPKSESEPRFTLKDFKQYAYGVTMRHYAKKA